MKNLETIIREVVDAKAEQDNQIDLHAYENGIRDFAKAINYNQCCTELPTKDDVYSEIKRLTDLYYNDDNVRKSAFGLGVSTGVNLVNKEILK